jgi:hypothetical protein
MEGSRRLPWQSQLNALRRGVNADERLHGAALVCDEPYRAATDLRHQAASQAQIATWIPFCRCVLHLRPKTIVCAHGKSCVLRRCMPEPNIPLQRLPLFVYAAQSPCVVEHDQRRGRVVGLIALRGSIC